MEKSAMEKLAMLARLELTEDELKDFPGQIVSVLEYVEKIQELKLPEDAPQMAHAVDLVNKWREDEPVEFSKKEIEALVDAFPEKVGDLNAVPAVFDKRV